MRWQPCPTSFSASQNINLRLNRHKTADKTGTNFGANLALPGPPARRAVRALGKSAQQPYRAMAVVGA
ncbi:hypothetical protein TMES_00045 [Thalassospira mesophila]|uniref:Uncharacterized protein n=1 Tax=Thalassospira mesophila TaxID=1293891 RepID=A0A1Y2L399_9PROT|nr:hypothetical protein TMES_00045 [Thalassospira mesophila]